MGCLNNENMNYDTYQKQFFCHFISIATLSKLGT